MMFVDACAIVSIIVGEPTSEAYEAELEDVAAFTSPLAAWEAIMVLARPDRLDCTYTEARAAVLNWLEGRQIELREGDPHLVLDCAVKAAEDYGVSRRSLSNLDCFHYAQAKAAGVPLLTLDERLRDTDVEIRPRTA